MRTARALAVSPSMLCMWAGVHGPGGVYGPRVCMVPGGCGIPACTEAYPPVNRILDTCLENITLPQTSFAGGNKNVIPQCQVNGNGIILVSRKSN